MKGRSTNQPSKMLKTVQVKPIRRPNPYQSTISKNISAKVVSNRLNLIKKPMEIRNRVGSRSIQQIYNEIPQSQRENGYKTQQNQEQDGLFALSHKKIGLIKQTFGTNKLIEFQLSEVLKLIKQEKNKIHETISELRQASDYYQSLCEFKTANKNNVFVNTQIILHKGTNESDFYSNQTQTNGKNDQNKESWEQGSSDRANQREKMIDQQIQVKLQQEIENADQQTQTEEKQYSNEENQTEKEIQNAHNAQKMEKSGLRQIKYQKWTAQRYVQTQENDVMVNKDAEKVKIQKQIQQISKQESQVYKKLVSMLSDMNINYKSILPEEVEVEVVAKDWKNLSEAEIIKIQKYFIKKLAQKIPQ